jgi:hypothetical protein
VDRPKARLCLRAHVPNAPPTQNTKRPPNAEYLRVGRASVGESGALSSKRIIEDRRITVNVLIRKTRDQWIEPEVMQRVWSKPRTAVIVMSCVHQQRVAAVLRLTL